MSRATFFEITFSRTVSDQASEVSIYTSYICMESINDLTWTWEGPCLDRIQMVECSRDLDDRKDTWVGSRWT